ncbi:hypothetical protein FRB97_006334 [Tulasnella sp. 331]|nr:hypothetical protein FRB97_006334 [Tulasnella sp. 331]
MTLLGDELAHVPVIILTRAPEAGRYRSEWLSVTTLNPALPPADSKVPEWKVPPEQLSSSIDAFMATLDESVKLRVQHIPSINVSAAGQPRVGILFSGGIDCSVIAYLAHQHLPIEEPIDLLNVAFENPRVLKANTSQISKKTSTQKKRDVQEDVLDSQPEAATQAGEGMYDVPDRLTGLEQLEELRRICPDRLWHFVEVDVPYETIMDLSLALALYFASRGIGTKRTSVTSGRLPYTSPARVLLSGLGSDELLGGYARHRHAFTRNSWQGLVNELQLDLTRLPSRNLGRDDRVISANGKETRYPYLSLTLVDFVAKLPVEVKADPRLSEGMGDKMLLRMAAAKLGLVTASQRRKRAMQFGSRSARMESGEKDGKRTISVS